MGGDIGVERPVRFEPLPATAPVELPTPDRELEPAR